MPPLLAAEHVVFSYDAATVVDDVSVEVTPGARLGVDPCGERGEYHTVVTNSPLFDRPMTLETGAVVQRSGCWALDVGVAA